MDFSLDLGEKSYRNIVDLDIFGPDVFSICINDEEIELPLLAAVFLSTKIAKLLKQDNTLRSFTVNQNFRKIRSKEIIKSALASKTQVFDVKLDENEVYDLAIFGSTLGNESFIKPLCEFLILRKSLIWQKKL